MSVSPQRVGSVAYSMVMFGVVSVVSGLLIAGLVVPFAGMAGVTSRAAADEMENLPAEFETPPQSERSRVLDKNGKVIAYFFEENRLYVKLDNIAPVMRQALLAIEDHRFYEHGPLDIKATLRALVRNQTAGGVSQGGSTISQQYVKMVRVEEAMKAGDDDAIEAAKETTIERKILELRYAIALEKKLSKDEILERYLNIAYFGEQSYGIEAAAKHYFNTSAKKLTLPQAALLAGLVQNPDANNPVKNESAAIDRRDVVLNRMASADLKIITPEVAATAKKETFDQDAVKTTTNGCYGTKYPFICDYVLQSLKMTPSLGKTVADREERIKRGGLTIETKFDPEAQKSAQKAVSNFVNAKEPLISVMTMIEPGTGLILGMAQSRPVMGDNKKAGETYWNYPAPTSMGGAEGFQAGSTFKAFTAAAALEKGIPVTKKFNAQKRMSWPNSTFQSCSGTVGIEPDYRPKNSTISGIMDMRKATAMSVNTYFLQLAKATGMCNVAKMAQKTGIEVEKNRPLIGYYDEVFSFTLGVANIAPLSLTEAYATFAAGGIHCDAVIISKIKTKAGKDLKPIDANCQRVMSKDVAAGVNSLLSGVMKSGGTGGRAAIPGVDNQAGKTGTTDSARAVWFAGYTREVAGSAMISVDNQSKRFKNDRGSLTGYRMKNSGKILEGSGGGDAGLIYMPAMKAAMKGKPDKPFRDPPKSQLTGKRVKMPSIAGLSINEATEKLEKEGFSVIQGRQYSNKVEAGSFIGFSPSGGMVEQFGTIYLVYSAGKDPAVVAARKEAERQAEAARKQAEELEKQRRQKEKDEQRKEIPPPKNDDESDEDGG